MTAPLSRAGLAGLAAALMALSLAYGVIRVHSVGWEPAADPGISFDEQTLRFVSLRPLGAADRAGLEPHDRLLSIDDRPVRTALEVHDAVRRAAPGDTLRLTVNLAGLNLPRTYPVVLDAREPAGDAAWVVLAGRGLVRAFPLLLLLAAAALLFARRDRLEPWLLALATTGAVATAPLLTFLWRIPPGARGFAVAFKILFCGMAPALLHYFLSIFPERSSHDRCHPQVKSYGLLAAGGAAVPFAVWAAISAGAGFQSSAWPAVGLWLIAISWIVVLGLGGWSLAECASASTSSAARTQARIVGAGAVTALVPAALLWLIAVARGQGVLDLPIGIQVAGLLALTVLPVAVGYAVVAPQVLPVTVVLGRSARWVAVGRGAIVPIVAIAGIAALALADLVSGSIRHGVVLGGAAGAACAAALVWGGMQVHSRAARTLERVLFPADAAARGSVERLPDSLRDAVTASEVVGSLELRLREAFKPSFLAVYLATGRGSLRVERGDVAPGMEEIPLDRALPVAECDRPAGGSTIGALDQVTRVGPDVLVPIRGSEPGLLGLLVLGQRDADEPYSPEELRLLRAAGVQAGVTLERLLLAAQTAALGHPELGYNPLVPCTPEPSVPSMSGSARD